MRKFLTTLIIFSITFIIADSCFYFVLDHSAELEVDKRLEDVINGNINKDIVIIGSSRGARNILANQLEKRSKLTAFNLSYPGSNIAFHTFLLQSLIKFNEKPEIVLLAIDDPAELIYNNSLNYRYERLYPLVKYDYINDEMIKHDKKNWLSKYVNFLRGNKSNLDLGRKHFSKMDTILQCGSMPIKGKSKDIKFDNNNQSYNIDDELPEKVEAFLAFQELCFRNNIKLIFCFSPNFYKFNRSFEKRIQSLCRKGNEVFVYDASNPIYKDSSLFYDHLHLQKKGALIYTKEVSDFIVQKMKLFPSKI